MKPDKSQLIAKAQEYIQAGEPKKALAHLKDYFQQNPHDYEILKLLAQAFLDLKQLEKAKFIYNEAVRILEEAGKTEEKESLLKEISKLLYPQKEEEIVVPEMSGLKELNDQEEEDKSHISKVINEADIFMKYGLPEKAISNLKEIVEEEPDNIEAHSKLKEIYEKTSNVASLKSELLILSDIAAKGGKTDLQKQYLDSLSLIDPDNQEVNLRLSKIDLQKEQSIQEPIVKEPQSMHHKESKEEISLGLDVLDELQESYELLKKVNDHSSAPNIILNEIEKSLAGEKKPTGLKVELENFMGHEDPTAKEPETMSYKKGLRAQAISSEEVQEGLRELQFFINNSMTKEAHEILEHLLKKYPDNSEIQNYKIKLKDQKKEHDNYINLGSFLEEKEKQEIQTVESLISQFKQGVQKAIPEGDALSHYNLGIAYLQMELTDSAIEELKLAEKSEEIHYNVHCLLGFCYEKKTDFHNALHYYKKAIEKRGIASEQKIDLFYRAALCSLSLNDQQSAQLYFKKVYLLNAQYKELPQYLKKLNLSKDILEKDTSDSSVSEISKKISFI